MNRRILQQRPERAQQREETRRLLAEANQNLGRVAGAVLNRLFALDRDAATLRKASLIFAFLISGVVIASLSAPHYPVERWAKLAGQAIAAIFSTNTEFDAGPVVDLIFLIWRAYTDPETVRRLPVLWIPFVLAWQLAAIYLQDIFELDHRRVARQFIMRAAFASRYQVIHIRNGDVVDEDKRTPLYMIGGPGLVQVELDSVAIFELNDGRPHLIPPTGELPRRVALLSGFERFRSAFDLRDHTTLPLRVAERTQDGMNVEARDVRMVFSVWRGGGAPTPQCPYPFVPNAIETLTYSQLRILPEPELEQATIAQAWPPPWANTMMVLIRTSLSTYIQTQPLGNFLAYTGHPETGWYNPAHQAISPRPALTNLFYDFARGFSARASQRGVELRWVGVGTWHTPDEILPERHMEAWRLTRENRDLARNDLRERRRREVRAEELLRLLREMPLAKYLELQDMNLEPRQLACALIRFYYARMEYARGRAEVAQAPAWWDPNSLNTLNRVLQFLDRVCAHYLTRTGTAPPAQGAGPRELPNRNPPPAPSEEE